MLEIFTLFIEKLLEPVGFIGSLLFFVWLVWSFLVWKTLNGPETKPGAEKSGRDKLLDRAADGLGFQKKYLDLLGWLLNKTTNWIKDKEKVKTATENARKKHWLGVPLFTVEAFEFNLKLALLYPILAFFFAWGVFQETGNLASLPILPEEFSWFERITALFGLMAIFYSFYKSKKTEGWKSLLWFAVAGAFAGAFAFAFAGAFAFAVAGAFAVAVAVAGAVAGAFAGAVAGAFAVAGTVAGAFAIGVFILYEKLLKHTPKKLWLFWGLFTLSYLVIAFVTIYWFSTQEDAKPEGLIILLFYTLLPLLNVPLDWLSLSITRSLLYAIQTKIHTGFRAVAWAVVDLFLAFIFLILITTVTTIGIAAVNFTADFAGGKPILDLTALFAGIHADPLNKEYWWIYFLFLSTLIPTALHALVASFAVIFWVPQKTLRKLVSNWQKDHKNYDFLQFSAVWGYLSFMPVLALLSPLIVLVGIPYLLLFSWGDVFTLGSWMLTGMENLARAIDPTMR